MLYKVYVTDALQHYLGLQVRYWTTISGIGGVGHDADPDDIIERIRSKLRLSQEG